MDPKQNAENLYQLGLAKHGEGDYEAALSYYSRILQTEYNVPEVHFRIAQIFLRSGDLFKARKHIKLASFNKAEDALIWQFGLKIETAIDGSAGSKAWLSEAKKHLWDKDLKALKQISNLRRAEPKLSTSAKKDAARIVQLLNAGKPGQANALVQKAILAHPKSGFFHQVLGTIQANQGNLSAAIRSFSISTKLEPYLVDSYLKLVSVFGAQNDHRKALSALIEARMLDPDNPKLIIKLARILKSLDREQTAVQILEQRTLPSQEEAERNALLGHVAFTSGQQEDAVKYFEAAFALGWSKTDAIVDHAISLGAIDRAAEGVDFLKKVVSENPNHARANFRLGMLLQELGEFEAANPLILKALDLDPSLDGLFPALLRVQERVQSEELLEKINGFANNPTEDPTNRSQAHYALFASLEKQKEFTNAEEHLRLANALALEGTPFDLTKHNETLSGAVDLIADKDASYNSDFGYDQKGLVLVTGMPRSGTTLVEQILASHSKVSGGGELGNGNTVIKQGLERLGLDFVRKDSEIEADLKELGQRIIDSYERNFDGKEVLTDKAINSYRYIGFFKKVLPETKIIVVRRDPMDNLFSIYKNSFIRGTHMYSYSLEGLAKTYINFRKFLTKWEELCPGSFYQIKYENLVDNTEEEARKLVAAAGLEWEDACLEFYKNERSVRTLSVYQVRQPIYKSSVKSWERYKEHLEPLRQMLENAGVLD